MDSSSEKDPADLAAREADAKAFLNMVEKELAEREVKLAKLEAEVRTIEFKLGIASVNSDVFDRGARRRAILTGDAGMLKAHEAHRIQLLEELRQKLTEKPRLVEEVSMAKERRTLAQEELLEIRSAS